MKQETTDYLQNARRDVADAEAIAKIGLSRVAARTIYYAIFHAAEAFIFEKTGKAVKTHSGVKAEFARLLRGRDDVDIGALRFLSEMYKHKEVADYGVGQTEPLSATDIAIIFERASDLIAQIEIVLAR